MDFKAWLIENAHRTAAGKPWYPPQWDTHPYDQIGVPNFHVSSSADLITWRNTKLAPHIWQNYEIMKQDGEKIVCTWPQIKLKPTGWTAFNYVK